MKLEITKDDGKKEVFQNITDLYIAVRQLQPMMNKKQEQAILPETRSFSYGDNVRELTKEITQSLVELQDYLRSLKTNV
jgi:hypothetical protein